MHTSTRSSALEGVRLVRAHILRRSLHIGLETMLFLFNGLLDDTVVFSTELVVVFVLELRPLVLLHLLFSVLAKVAELLCNFAPFNEQLHLAEVLFFEVSRVSRVLCLQKDSEALEHGFLDAHVWMLEPILADLTQSSCDY